MIKDNEKASLTLLIPGLLGPRVSRPAGLAEGLSLDALETLLCRSDRRPAEPLPLAAMLFAAFGVPPREGDWPVAAVTREVDLGGSDEGWWLRADPVHLRADRDALVMLGSEVLALTMDEAEQLRSELEGAFASIDGELVVGAPLRWYLRLPRASRVDTYMPSQVMGQNIDPYLPHGDEGAQWRALMNEAQMILNMSPVNQARHSRGVPAVNSLWFWGGGARPQLDAPAWTQAWCDHAVGRGLAGLAGVPCCSVPPGAGDWLSEGAAPGCHLAVIESADNAAQSLDIEQWREAIQAINDQWIAPLMAALKAGRLAQVELITGACADFNITPAKCRRWWRRRKPLSHYS